MAASSWSVSGRTEIDVASHDAFDFGLRFSDYELAQIDDALETVVGVEDVEVVRLLSERLAGAQERHRLADGHVLVRARRILAS